MSANNYVRIRPVAVENRTTEKQYQVETGDMESEGTDLLTYADKLETAIRYANKYMEDNEVEYGLQVIV